MNVSTPRLRLRRLSHQYCRFVRKQAVSPTVESDRTTVQAVRYCGASLAWKIWLATIPAQFALMTKMAMLTDLSPAERALRDIQEPLTGSFMPHVSPIEQEGGGKAWDRHVRQLKLDPMINTRTAYLALLLPVSMMDRLAT